MNTFGFNIYFFAVLLGFISSIHCITMCLPFSIFFTRNSFSNTFFYFSGKIFAYLTLGMVALSIGLFFDFFGYITYLSIFIGLSLILYSLFRAINFRFNSPISKIILEFAQKQQNHKLKTFLWGLANGFIPCGLSYGLALSSTTTTKPTDTILTMFIFGLSTSSVLISSKFLINYIPKFNLNQNLILFALGCYMIFRTGIFEDHIQNKNHLSVGNNKYACRIFNINTKKE